MNDYICRRCYNRFDQHALIDLPTMLTGVMEVTGQSHLYYVGHSQVMRSHAGHMMSCDLSPLSLSCRGRSWGLQDSRQTNLSLLTSKFSLHWLQSRLYSTSKVPSLFSVLSLGYLRFVHHQEKVGWIFFQ